MEQQSLMILVAGPYRSGTGDDPDKMTANVAAMEAYTLPLFWSATGIRVYVGLAWLGNIVFWLMS